MKFLLDENIEVYLREHGRDVTATGRHDPAALGDQDVWHLAQTEQMILSHGSQGF